MSVTINLTTKQLEQRLGWVEGMIVTAHPKDLPALNQTYQRIMDELVRRDLEKEDAHSKGNGQRGQSHRGRKNN